MTYKTYKIVSRTKNSGWIKFELNDYVTFEGGSSQQRIDCVNRSPFSNWDVGDYLEIDIDRVRCYSSGKDFDDTNIIRKACSDLIGFQAASSPVAPFSFVSAVSNAHRSGEDYQAYIEQRDNRGEILRSAFATRKDGNFYDGFFQK